MLKKTKIICTLGPSTDKPEIIEQLINAGMNVARFNFSHGTHEEQGKRIALVREVSAKLKRPLPLMLDTKGPEMRLGFFSEDKVMLTKGQQFILTSENVSGTKERVQVNHVALPREVEPGNQILISDGLVGLVVEKVEGNNIYTKVLNGGQVGNRKRVAVPGVHVSLPPLSEQDVEDLLFGIEQNMDFIAVSFVQRAADVLAIRKVLESSNASMDIYSKIENAEGVKHIDDIIKVSDGIMVARGDLGVEIPTEEVPLVQKMIVQKCNKAGKPVIIATQMLESMIANPRPTRAEASDIANAILDGTDVIMLSGETASGQYPVEAVKIMAQIAIRTENALEYTNILGGKGILPHMTTTEAISHATVQVAQELGAAAIITVTESGYTARMVSKYRPRAAIVAVTPYETTARRMQIMWGVQPLLGPKPHNTDEMVNNSVTEALSAGIVKDGDLIVITAGVPMGTTGTTNMIRVYIVGNILMKGVGIGQKVVTGKLCVVTSIKEIHTKFNPGDVLVVSSINEKTAIFAAKASAIVAEEGGLTSYAAIIGISYGIPIIVGADGATKLLNDGMLVTVDAGRGLVYQGEINAR